MPISSGPLGMNARNFLYVRRYNSLRAKKIADNKLRTKRLLIANKIPTVRLIKAFNTRESVREYDWNLPEEGFVVKPARGYGGEGILVFNRFKNGRGRTISGKRYNLKQLESHIFDIFEGVYSLQALPDKAYIEEKVIPHKFFKKFAEVGLPDIRVLVFNKIPIMAMLRLPTWESKGTANIHLGAVGIGIDIRTGITSHATLKGRQVTKIPSTNIKTRGIKIPYWDQVMELALKAQEVSGLGYMGADIVFDAKKGPVVLEINARPGLEIQKANRESLRLRLEKVEDVKVPTAQRGIELAKSLFATAVTHKVDITPVTLSVFEPVTFISGDVKKTYNAKIDSGAFRTAVDWSVVREMDLTPLPKKIWVDSANGKQKRSAVKVNFIIAGRQFKTIATVTDRAHLNHPVIIGRKNMKGFVINPNLISTSQELSEDY